MPEHIQYEDDDLFNPDTHHESSDVPIRPLWWAVIIFVVFAVITHIVLWFFYKGLVNAERKRMDPPQTAVARPADASVPKNQPLLQPFPKATQAGHPLPPNQDTPVVDLHHLRDTEKRALTTYGWVDKEKGIARIPIDVAKDKLVQQMGGTQ